MKKMMALLFAASMICVSCDKDKEDTPPPAEVTASVSYSYQVNADLLEMTDINLFYMGADGKEVKEALTTTAQWTKTLTKVSLPFQAKLRVVYTAKAGFVASKASYIDASSYAVGYQTTDSRMDQVGSSSKSSVPKDKAVAYIDLLAKQDHVYTLNIAK